MNKINYTDRLFDFLLDQKYLQYVTYADLQLIFNIKFTKNLYAFLKLKSHLYTKYTNSKDGKISYNYVPLKSFIDIKQNHYQLLQQTFLCLTNSEKLLYLFLLDNPSDKLKLINFITCSSKHIYKIIDSLIEKNFIYKKDDLYYALQITKDFEQRTEKNDIKIVTASVIHVDNVSYRLIDNPLFNYNIGKRADKPNNKEYSKYIDNLKNMKCDQDKLFIILKSIYGDFEAYKQVDKQVKTVKVVETISKTSSTNMETISKTSSTNIFKEMTKYEGDKTKRSIKQISCMRFDKSLHTLYYELYGKNNETLQYYMVKSEAINHLALCIGFDNIEDAVKHVQSNVTNIIYKAGAIKNGLNTYYSTDTTYIYDHKIYTDKEVDEYIRLENSKLFLEKSNSNSDDSNSDDEFIKSMMTNPNLKNWL